MMHAATLGVHAAAVAARPARPAGRQAAAHVAPSSHRRGARFVARAGGGINKNDPSTWYNSGAQQETPVMSAEEEQDGPSQMLSEEQFAQLLSGASVPTPVPGSARVESLVSSADRPAETAGDAIAAGLKAFQAGDTAGALELFEQSLQLPGTGVMRVKGKPRDLSLGERQAALYNCACCHAKLGNDQDGLLAVAACLESGFDNFALLRNDADLAPLRKNPKYAGLIARFEPKGASGFFANLFSGR